MTGQRFQIWQCYLEKYFQIIDFGLLTLYKMVFFLSLVVLILKCHFWHLYCALHICLKENNKINNKLELYSAKIIKYSKALYNVRLKKME